MSDLVLYNYYRSSTSYRARIALHLKNLPFEYKAVSLIQDGGQQHKPDYLRLNPAAEVPTLVHEGRVIAQSMAVIEYLDDVFPQNPLFPKDAFHRAKVKQICEGINCGHSLTNLKVQQFLSKEMGVSDAKKSEWVIHWFSRLCASTEAQLRETAGRYGYGDTPTAVDAFVIPHLFSAERFGVDTSAYPTLKRVNDECLKLEAFQKAHPSRQPDTPKT
jgi:maleylacetoacetate isomerase/maleylpyruvate isomerase